jgi:hypothetical protein
MNNLYWTTKTGVVIHVDDMDDEHVRNAFKMLLRNRAQPTIKPQPFELNGDMAQFFNDSYFEDENSELLDEITL